MHACQFMNAIIGVLQFIPFVITAHPVLRVKRVREPIPAYLEGGRGYTLDKLPVHIRATEPNSPLHSHPQPIHSY